ncbi:hypothetical protein G9A89_002636 [Geosiphon pyriformis]|nr:hypothetical protein G9A89_002636 [Geosiphon pyriformis]
MKKDIPHDEPIGSEPATTTNDSPKVELATVELPEIEISDSEPIITPLAVFEMTTESTTPNLELAAIPNKPIKFETEFLKRETDLKYSIAYGNVSGRCFNLFLSKTLDNFGPLRANYISINSTQNQFSNLSRITAWHSYGLLRKWISCIEFTWSDGISVKFGASPIYNRFWKQFHSFSINENEHILSIEVHSNENGLLDFLIRTSWGRSSGWFTKNGKSGSSGRVLSAPRGHEIVGAHGNFNQDWVLSLGIIYRKMEFNAHL